MTRLSVVFLLCLSGCTHAQLRRSTVQQASTITDLHYQQVVDNLALFKYNENSLASFAVVGGGAATVTDTASGSPGVAWDPFGFMGATLGLQAQREIQENWTLANVTDPDKLFQLRCAFRWVVSSSDDECSECCSILSDYFDDGFCACKLQRGWFGWGRRRDVPKNACYVGCYCGTYVWVPREGISGLSYFTTSILDIATNAPDPGATVVRTFEGRGSDPYGDFPDAVKTEVTTTEAPPPVPDADQIKKRLTQAPKATGPGFNLFAPQMAPLTSDQAKTVVDHATEKRAETQPPPRQRLNFFDPYRSLLSRPR